MTFVALLPGVAAILYAVVGIVSAKHGVPYTPIFALFLGCVWLAASYIVTIAIRNIRRGSSEQARLWKMRLAAFFVSATLAIVLCEFIAASLLRSKDMHELRIHQFASNGTVAGIGFKTGFRQQWTTPEFSVQVKLNNVGLRENDDYHGESIDIGCYGDSFTFGHGVEHGERYSDLLREYFPSKRIVSFSYKNGWTTPHYFLFMKRHPEMLPKVGILGLFLGNDLTCDMEECQLIVDNEGELQRIRPLVRRVDRRGFLVNRDVDLFVQLGGSCATGELAMRVLNRLGFQRPMVSGANVYPELTFDQGYLEATNIQALEFVKRMHDHFHSNGRRLIVMLIPWSYYVNGYPSYHPPRIAAEIRRNQALPRTVTKWLTARGVEVVDSVPPLTVAERTGKRTYFLRDAHWNKVGHAVAAQLLADQIRKKRTGKLDDKP